MHDLFAQRDLSVPFEMPVGLGYGATWNEEWRGYDIVVPNGEMFYAEHFFDQKISDRTVDYFQENNRVDWHKTNWREVSSNELDELSFSNICWKQDWIKFYGKNMPLPRLTSWYGDRGASYTYSGIRSEPNDWNKGLLYIKERVERCAGERFNSVLLNWYRDGEDHLSWHSDNEKELGTNPIIGSVNFGATRDFLLRRVDDKSKKVVIPLKHGTLLIMKGELQHFWQHSIPKRKNVRSSRFNLTFRRIGI
jgi:alkylated DNA repair dioxygenase AlkB